MFMIAAFIPLATAGILISLSYCKEDAGFHLRKTAVTVRCVDYEFAVRKTADGVPRFDWARFQGRPQQIISQKQTAVVLTNRFFRATIIPSRGRIRSFIPNATGNEELWINPAAVPIPAHNDTGFWITWG